MVNSVDTRTLPDRKAQTGSTCRGTQAGQNGDNDTVCAPQYPSPAFATIAGGKPVPVRRNGTTDQTDQAPVPASRTGTVPDLDQRPVPNVHPCRKGELTLIDDPAFAVGLAIWQARLARVNGAPFPEVIRDLLLGHAIEGDAACEMMLACLGLPETEHEGASPPRFSTGLQPLMEGGQS
jgi:hypothetical protein